MIVKLKVDINRSRFFLAGGILQETAQRLLRGLHPQEPIRKNLEKGSEKQAAGVDSRTILNLGLILL